MYTTIALFALTASVTTGNLATPTWQTDYRAAQAAVTVSGKPLAVFIANGTGWESVVTDGIDANTKKVLAEKFVCLFIDATTFEGRNLATAFQVGRGLVISDRTGTVQAYSVAGDLTKSELATVLTKYSDGTAVETTETVLRGSEIAYGGSCSTGKCYTGTCATGTCGSPVYFQGTVAPGTTAPAAPAAAAPVTAAPTAAPVYAAPTPCATGGCGTTTSCGSSRGCFSGFGCFRSKCGGSMPSCGTPCAAPAPAPVCHTSYAAPSCGGRSGCFGGFNKCGFGGGMKSCGTWGGGCSTGGCR
ncbi:MAG TPA: hypothetical protein VM597_10660 [Gemmataceae bacterium]|jgi:hypothetical protein|nr:hypothetical protein [Gemmataceae bacterium]